MGTPPQPPQAPQQHPGSPYQKPPGPPGIGIAGFVCGLVGLLLFWIPFLGLILAGIGIVLSVLGMRQATEKEAPKGLAIAGLVCGIVGTLGGLAITIATLAAVDEIGDEIDDLTFTTTTFNLIIGLKLLRGRMLEPLDRIRG